MELVKVKTNTRENQLREKPVTRKLIEGEIQLKGKPVTGKTSKVDNQE